MTSLLRWVPRAAGIVASPVCPWQELGVRQARGEGGDVFAKSNPNKNAPLEGSQDVLSSKRALEKKC